MKASNEINELKTIIQNCIRKIIDEKVILKKDNKLEEEMESLNWVILWNVQNLGIYDDLSNMRTSKYPMFSPSELFIILKRNTNLVINNNISQFYDETIKYKNEYNDRNSFCYLINRLQLIYKKEKVILDFLKLVIQILKQWHEIKLIKEMRHGWIHLFKNEQQNLKDNLKLSYNDLSNINKFSYLLIIFLKILNKDNSIKNLDNLYIDRIIYKDQFNHLQSELDELGPFLKREHEFFF